MASSDTPAFANEAYTVGWICALPLEMAAAKAMLDKKHGAPQKQNVADKNNYYLGQIGDHNVVVACLPAGVYGQASASAVAQNMLSSFGSIKFGLMVGIGGGVPRGSGNWDIRLGDVVVSQPAGTFGGVVQFDFGKIGRKQAFKRTGSLNKPPQLLLSALSQIRSTHYMEGSQIQQFLSEMATKYPNLKDFQNPPAKDLLYEAKYEHVGESETCERCDHSKLFLRPSRVGKSPTIHYGTIASGGKVMKNGVTRDEQSKELGNIMCFEMEAAGLMDTFPCLVIRGISDYADTHKNKQWQRYAAAVAAAYAKELLYVVPKAEVDKSIGAQERVFDRKTIYEAGSPDQTPMRIGSQDTPMQLRWGSTPTTRTHPGERIHEPIPIWESPRWMDAYSPYQKSPPMVVTPHQSPPPTVARQRPGPGSTHNMTFPTKTNFPGRWPEQKRLPDTTFTTGTNGVEYASGQKHKDSTPPPVETASGLEQSTQPSKKTASGLEQSTQPPRKMAYAPEQSTRPLMETAYTSEQSTRPSIETAYTSEQSTRPSIETAYTPEQSTRPSIETAYASEQSTRPSIETAYAPEQTTHESTEEMKHPTVGVAGAVAGAGAGAVAVAGAGEEYWQGSEAGQGDNIESDGSCGGCCDCCCDDCCDSWWCFKC